MNYNNYFEELEDYESEENDNNVEIEHFMKKNNKVKKNGSKLTKFKDNNNKKYK